MNCENLQSRLPLFIDDVLTDEEQTTIERHLTSCPLCRQKVADYKDFRSELRMVSRPVIPAELLNSVRNAVAQEINRPTLRTGTEIEPAFSEKLAHWILPYSVGTVVASIFAFFLLSVLLSTKDVTTDLISINQQPEESTIILAKSTPGAIPEELILPPEYDQLSVTGYPPKVNPAGALVALTKSIVRGKMSDEEVVIVASVFSNGMARINEIVEAPSDDKAMAELRKAFQANPEETPFLPVSSNQKNEPTLVVIKLQQVNVVDINSKPAGKKRKGI